MIFSFSAQAEAADQQRVSGYYIGGGIGNPSGELDSMEDIELKDNSYHVIAGYQEGRIFALEFQYVKYGKDAYNFFNPSSFSVSTNMGYTFDNGIRPFAVLGLGVTDVNIPSISGTVIADADVSYHYGVGIEFAPKQLNGMTFRLAHEADFVNIEENVYIGFGSWQTNLYDVDLSSTYAALVYKF